MFKPLAVAVAALSISLAAQAEPLLHQHPYDYMAHAGGGSTISFAGDYLGLHPAAGVGIAAAVGVAAYFAPS